MAEIRFPVEIDSGDAATELNRTLKQIQQLTKEAAKADASVAKAQQAVTDTEAKRSAIAEPLKDARDVALEALANVKKLKAALEASEKKTGIGSKLSEVEKHAEEEKQKEITEKLSKQEEIRQSANAEVQYFASQDMKLASSLDAANAKLQEAQSNAAGVKEQLADAQEKAGQLTEQVSNTKGVADLKAQFEQVNRTMAKGLKNILKYALGIRSMYVLFNKLKAYTKEAVKAFAENDPDTKQKLNDIKASLSALKGAWGAAFSPIVSAVIPYLQKLIDWLATAMNSVAAFFAAINGKTTFKKAVADSAALSDNVSSAAGSAKELQKEMMGIDTLNTASDSSGGGGGSSSSSGFTYEDAEISDKILNNLELIKTLAEGIGAALAGWTISKLFGGDLKTAIGLAVSLYSIVKFIKNMLDAWNNGVDWENFFGMLGWAIALAGGLYIAFGKVGAGIGLIVSGIAMVVTAFHDFIENGDMSTETAALLAAGILAIGAGIWLVGGGWIPFLIAAIVALFAFLAAKWDEINEWLQGIIDAVNNFFETEIDELSSKGNLFADIFTVFWTAVRTIFNAIVLVVRTAFDTICAIFRTIAAVIKGIATGDWKTALNTISEIWSGVWENIKGGFKNIVNGLLDGLEGLINGSISAINNFLKGINDIGGWLGFGINLHINPISIPRLAKGGIVDGATPFIAGEAGKEAIIPLERNTEWVTMVAKELESLLFSSDIFDKIAQSISGIPTALDRMTAQLAALGSIQMPAVATGGIVPPNAFSASGGYGYSSELENKLDALLERLTGNQQTYEIHTTVELDKRKVGESIYSYLNERNRGRGK